MSPGRARAEIWPSRLALRQRQSELARGAPGGLLLAPSLFTLAGRDGLLKALSAQLPTNSTHKPLADLAGPLLVHQLLRQDSSSAQTFGGLARGHRLPHRLWRLLLQIKAAGLSQQDLRAFAPARQGQGRLAALAGLLRDYQDVLEQRLLLDEADQLAALEQALAKGLRPPLLAAWQSLEVKEALWLRPLDLRLLRALAACLPVRVSFGLGDPRQDQAGVFRLLRRTAQVLEADPLARVDIAWNYGPNEEAPLSGLVDELLEASPPGQSPQALPLELLRPAGRYAEVSALLERVLDLLGQGVAAHRIALVFPDLSLYGPLCADVAGRWGVNLEFRRPQALLSAPLVQDFLLLLKLPLGGYQREDLAQAWQSPYLGPALCACLASRLGQDLAGRLAQSLARSGRLLAEAGYVDARETPARVWLEQAAGRSSSRQEMLDLAQACAWLSAWLAPLEKRQDLPAYCAQAAALLAQLDLGQALARLPQAGAWPGLPSGPALALREMASLRGLGQGLRELETAALQIQAQEEQQPGRLLAELRQALAEKEGAALGAASNGVKVLRLEDTQGLDLSYVMVGGLVQGAFPARPQAGWLSQEERLALGKRAGLPVWRTEEEEYSGQNLRLLLLLARTRQAAVLSCPGFDGQGKVLYPAFLFSKLAEKLKLEIPLPREGVFGELPALGQAREPLAVWAGLSRALLAPRPAGLPADGQDGETGLARALLWHLLQEPGQGRRWQGLLSRLAPLETPWPGPALDLLHAIMAFPRRRRLSASQLEEYAACPRQWFYSRLLDLSPEETPAWDLARQQEGIWVHAALALFFAPDSYDPAWSAQQRAQRLDSCLEQAQAQLEAQGLAGHRMVRQLRGQGLRQALLRLVERECQEMDPWRPWAVERALGQDGQGLELPVEQGPPLSLQGRLDRLDFHPAQGVRVVDYKHGRDKQGLSAALKPGNFGQSAFQLPLYLAGAAQFWPQGDLPLRGRLAPTSLLGLKLDPVDMTCREGFLSMDPDLRRQRAAQGEENIFNRIVEVWQGMLAGGFPLAATAQVCPRCPHVLICAQASQAGHDADDAAQPEAGHDA